MLMPIYAIIVLYLSLHYYVNATESDILVILLLTIPSFILDRRWTKRILVGLFMLTFLLSSALLSLGMVRFFHELGVLSFVFFAALATVSLAEYLLEGKDG